MRRVLFRVGRLNIYSYPAMLYVGIVVGIWVQLYLARQVAIEPATVLTATVVLLMAALLGARLLFVIPRWSDYRRQPRRIWRYSEGGASMYGGLLLALPLSAPVLWLLRIPLGVYWDLSAFTMVIGMIVTRIGCLLNGCCAGRPTRGWFALELADHHGVRTRRIPVQIMEFAWGLVVLGGAIMLWGRLPFAGALFLYAVATYAAGRMALESARAVQDRVRGVVLQQALSAALLAISVAVFVVVRWL